MLLFGLLSANVIKQKMEDYGKADPGGENLLGQFVEIGDSIILVENVESTEHELSGNVEYCEEETDEQKLEKFLEDIDMISIFDYLQASQVTYRSLPYLDEQDVKEAVVPLGLRAEFRKKLFSWQKSQLGIEDVSLTSTCNVVDLTNGTEAITSPSTLNCTSSSRILSKDLKSLLNESPKGMSVLEYANKNQTLMSVHRDDIISIIIEEVINKNIVLHTQDFKRILDEIFFVFPFENDMQDYYYISRKGKNNASGRLYSKYKNKCIKRRKILDSNISTPNTVEECFIDINDSLATALKTSLNRDCANWESVCEKWKKSYKLRQRDLKKLNSLEFLREWPKLSDSRAPDLINIDFDIMYPLKGHLLLAKWENFKEKIIQYYSNNIHNEYCKQLLEKALSATSIDAQDYLYTILLIAVLQSQSRFKCEEGKRMKKVTIVDSQESLVLRLVTINDYKRQIKAVTDKYYSAGLSIQPFMIVEGLSDADVRGYYIYFNNNLLKLNSFLECLDTCFKVFHTLSLKYPDACQLPWVFIQKFFYGINTTYDPKSASISSLINFLQ